MKKSFFSFLALLWAINLCGQIQAGLPLSFSFFDESIQLPNHHLFGGALNPGFQVSTNMVFTKGTTHHIGVYANFGGFYHKKIAKTFFVGVDFFYRWQANSKIKIEPSIGIAGNFHQIPQTIYMVQNGEPSIKKTKASLNPMPNIGLKMGYHLRPNQPVPVCLFVQYKWGMELDFLEPIPQLPHSFFAVGVDLYLQKKK